MTIIKPMLSKLYHTLCYEKRWLSIMLFSFFSFSLYSPSLCRVHKKAINPLAVIFYIDKVNSIFRNSNIKRSGGIIIIFMFSRYYLYIVD